MSTEKVPEIHSEVYKEFNTALDSLTKEIKSNNSTTTSVNKFFNNFIEKLQLLTPKELNDNNENLTLSYINTKLVTLDNKGPVYTTCEKISRFCKKLFNPDKTSHEEKKLNFAEQFKMACQRVHMSTPASDSTASPNTLAPTSQPNSKVTDPLTTNINLKTFTTEQFLEKKQLVEIKSTADSPKSRLKTEFLNAKNMPEGKEKQELLMKIANTLVMKCKTKNDIKEHNIILNNLEIIANTIKPNTNLIDLLSKIKKTAIDNGNTDMKTRAENLTNTFDNLYNPIKLPNTPFF